MDYKQYLSCFGVMQVTELLLPCIVEQVKRLWLLAGTSLPSLGHSRRLPAAGQAIVRDSITSAETALQAFIHLCRSVAFEQLILVMLCHELNILSVLLSLQGCS